MDLGAARELDSRAATERGGEFLFRRLDPQPVVVADRGDAPFGEQRAEPLRPRVARLRAGACRLHVGSGALGQPEQARPWQLDVIRARPSRQVGQQAAHGLGGVGFVRADHTRRSALEPPGDVLAWLRLAVRAEHAPVGVRNRVRALVERHSGQRHALIPDAAQHHLDRQPLILAGPDQPPRGVQPGPLQS